MLVMLILACASEPGSECLDSDRVHREIAQDLRDRLKDPDSLKIYSSSMIYVDWRDPDHVFPHGIDLHIDYGARNSFGAMVRDTIFVVFDPVTCELLWSG